MAEDTPGAGEVCRLVFAERFCSRVGVNATGDADGDAVAVSGTGNASSDTVAVSGTGQAEAPIAVSVDGDSRGNIVVAGTGDANSSECTAVECAAVSGTGNASGPVAASARGCAEGSLAVGLCDKLVVEPTGDAEASIVAVSGTGNATAPIPLSATGGCRENASEAYRPCLQVSPTGNATGYYAAASGTGNASGPLAASVFGCAEGGVAVDGCDTVVVRPSGDANGSMAAASGSGDAEGGFVAVSGTGNATGVLAAASGTGNASGFVATSGAGNASGSFAAASGSGDATGGFSAASTMGNASSFFAAASGTGNASGAFAAASGTQNATSDRHATSADGDANCTDDWGAAGCTAVSGTENASGPRAVDQGTAETLANSSTRDRDHRESPTSTDWPDKDFAAIRPGVRVATEAGLCTTNFVFSDATNTTLYIGTAGHCLVDDEPGDEVAFPGSSASGRVVLNGTEEPRSEDGSDCPRADQLDFGLIEIPDRFRDEVHPAVLSWGGPTDIRERARSGEQLFMYGNSPYRAGQVGALEGWSLGNHRCATETVFPGAIYGDSGSPVLASDGAGLGVLVRAPGFVEVVNLAPSLAFAEAHTGIDLELKTWTTFRSGTLQDNGDVPTSPSTSTGEAVDEPATTS